ncbi:MAG: hypothetical protein WD080_12945 [Egibacteraceae bacterium]
MTAARHRRLLTLALAGLSAGAGAAHVSIIAEHVAVVWWYGAAFGLVALLQLAWAAALVRRSPSRRVLAAGAIGHGIVLGAWVLARTAGLPFVPGDGSSAVGLLDGTTALFQGLIVAGVLATASTAVRLRPRLQQAVGVTAAAVLLLTAPVTVTALAAGPGHTHEEPHTGQTRADHADQPGHPHPEPAAPTDHADQPGHPHPEPSSAPR